MVHLLTSKPKKTKFDNVFRASNATDNLRLGYLDVSVTNQVANCC